MSISGISSNDYLYQFFNRVNTTQSDFLASSKSKSTEATATSTKNSKDQIATDLNALWEALQAGNLTSAQSYFSQLQKDVQAFGTNDSESTTSVLSSSSSSESNPMAEDFSTLEEALNSGDLTGAQNAFAQIMQHMQPPPPPPNFNASNDTQSGSNPLADDLKTLEEALNSGDLTSAQTILAQIMQNMQPPDASASGGTQGTSTSSLFSSGNSDMMSKLIEAMLTAYSGYNTSGESKSSYYA